MIILEIISAEAKRVENFLYTQEQKRLEEERKEKELQNKEKAVEMLFNWCKKNIKNSHYGYCSFYLTEMIVKDMYPYSHSYEEALKETFNIVKLLLEKAGYLITIHFYSKSWTTRSGRFAEISINY